MYGIGLVWTGRGSQGELFLERYLNQERPVGGCEVLLCGKM